MHNFTPKISQKIFSQERRAFTLIELVVVIAIIALLTTIIIIYLEVSLGKARDVRRISDLDNLKKSVDYYKIDHMEKYPVVGLGTAWHNLAGELNKTFPFGLPPDPRNNLYFNYIYCSDPYGLKYLLAVRLEGNPPKAGLNGRLSYTLENCVSSSPEASHLVPVCDGEKNYCAGTL